MNKSTIRLEANAGIVVCFGIVAATIGAIIISGSKEKTKKSIEISKIEQELRMRNAEAMAKEINSTQVE